MANELNSNQIAQILPHRFPFALVDRITDYEPGQWAKGRKCVTIYSKDYDRALGEIFAAGYQNDTDSQTDYFDKGRVNIYEGHPLYEKAMERVKMNDAAFEVRQEKKKAERAERANARFYR